MVTSADTPKNAPPEAVRRKRRRKIPLACEPCRERKSRCDGGKPICSGCQRRSLRLEDCVYSLDNARSASNDEYIRTLHDRIRQLERRCSEGGLGMPSGTSSAVPDGGDGLTMGLDEQDGEPSATNPPPPMSIQPPRLRPTATPAPAKPSPASSSSQHHHSADLSVWKLPLAPPPPPPTRGLSPSHHSSDLLSRPSPRFDQQAPDDSAVNAMGVISSEDGVAGDTPTTRTSGRDYYGGSSAASFIRETFGTIHRNTPGAPTAPIRPYVSEPTGTRTPSGLCGLSYTTNFALPPRRLADHLLEVYFRRIYYLYPFFYRPAFTKAYRALWDPTDTDHDPLEYPGVGLGGSPDEGPSSIVFHCALNGIFALACYSSDLPPQERMTGADTFFERSKAHLSLALLEHNSMGAIQALLVTALYLQSTPYPGRCWNSVGIACRMAQGLGLHAQGQQQQGGGAMGVGGGRTTLEREMRLRTWYGCVVLDMLVSMTFGRPTMTTFVPNLPLPSIADDAATVEPEGAGGGGGGGGGGGILVLPGSVDLPTRIQFYVESIRLAKVLEQILVRVYQPWKSKGGGDHQKQQQQHHHHHHHFSLDTVIELDAQLSQVERSVPWPLSWLPGVNDGVSPRALPQDMALCLVMQRIVLQSRFLYLRLMLFRPVLSQLAADRDRGKGAEPPPPSSTNRSILSSSFGVECGKSCAQAAVDLINLTHATYLAPESGAWWWSGLYASTAGLVLIVARSCPSVWMCLDHSQIQRAWGHCQEILTELSSVSVSCEKSLQLLQAIYESSHAQTSETQPAGNELCPKADSVMPTVSVPTPVDGMAGADMFGFMDMDMMNTALMSWDQNLDFFDFSNGM